MTDFAHEGAVVLRGVLNPAEVQLLAQGIEVNLADLSPEPAKARPGTRISRITT